MSTRRLTWPQVIGRRLERHHLLEAADAGDLVTVASDVCGVHAQVAASAELMLGVRTREVTRQDVRRAMWEQRTLVKTVGLRGTLHIFPADEVPSWMAGTRLRLDGEERRLERAGMDITELRAAIAAISDIVGPTPIGRPELERELESRVGGWSVAGNEGWMTTYKNWPLALRWAAANGAVCYGPGEGGRSTFVRLSDWSSWRDVNPMDGGRFALRRYLHAYGPSTPAEFARWFGVEPAIAKALFESVADDIVEVEVEGSRRWMLSDDLDSIAEPQPDAVHLLPHFDVFVVGSHPRAVLMDPESPVARLSPGTAAPFAVLTVGGKVAGVWDRTSKGKRLVIRVDAHRPLTRKHRAAIEARAARVAQVLERECELEFGHVPSGPTPRGTGPAVSPPGPRGPAASR